MYDVCNGTGTTTTTLTLTVGTGTGTLQGAPIGDLVVVCAGASGGPSQSVVSVTDSKSNTYAAQVADSASSNTAAMWTSLITAALVSGTDTVTITWSSATGGKQGIVKGTSGVSSATADQAVHASAASTAPDSGPTGVLAQASELAVGVICNANAGKAPTALSSGGAGTTAQSGTGEYLTQFAQSVSSTVSLDMTGTLSVSANWCALAATFRLAGSGLSVTSLTPPAGTVGTAYNAGSGYTLTNSATTGPYTWSVKTGPLPPGLTLSPGSAGGHICGNSIKSNKNTAGETALYNTWNGSVASGGLGLYTVQARKIYFTSPNGPAQAGNFPVNATAALWKANNSDVGASLTNGMGMHLCFRPVATGTFNDPGWPGGAVFASPGNAGTPGTILGDYALMKATIQSLQAACTSVANGASVLSVIIWQENDNKSGFPGVAASGGTSFNAFVGSHNYFAYYPLLKADFPNLPVYVSYVNYPHVTPPAGSPAIDALDRSQRFPGPSPLNPSGWGTALVNGNSTNLFCDGITTDEYADGAYADNAGTPGVNVPTGRLRYMYAEPDLYTPATSTTAAKGNPGWADVADFNGIGWGNLETGNNASTGNPDLVQMQQYLVGWPLANPAPLAGDKMLHSILAVYQQRVASGAPIIGMCWYENSDNPPPPAGTGQNNILDSSDPRIPWLNAIDAATAASTGTIINGTPTKDPLATYPVTYPVTVQVKDASGTKATGLLSFVVNTGTATLAVTTGTLVSGIAGQLYSQQLANNGGGTGTGYTWTLNAGTLAGSGITLSSGGLLSGSSPVAGTYSGLQFKVTDSGAHTALSVTGMSIVINAAGVIVQVGNTSPLPNGTTGQVYAVTLTASGGTGPYTYALAATSAPLPPGLIIDSTPPLNDQGGNPLRDQSGVNLEDQTGAA